MRGRAGRVCKLERFEFYERARKAYAVIQIGEERQYGSLLLVKGVEPALWKDRWVSI